MQENTHPTEVLKENRDRVSLEAPRKVIHCIMDLKKEKNEHYS